ncbi:MAG TPA: hypothetical protein VFB79_03575 [Candidatus Angelobacter sp.]|nr:hypothetical protein [Candidatus Angelobacter sp.]
MKKLKNLFFTCVVTCVFAAIFTILTGCGGHADATALASPTPTPSSPGSGGGTTPSNAVTIANIQTQAGWENCTACTGSAAAIYSMTEGITAPALSGSSAQFQLLNGTQPFGGALWFKFLGAQNSATHFVYDLFFYIDNPAAAQAIEFNVSQSDGQNRYSFATQCDLKGAKAWRVWNPIAGQWVASAVACALPAAKTWNHLVWEFERDSAGNVIFTAVTVNGSRGAVNLSMAHTADTSNGIDIAYQSDADLNGTPYSVWLDKVSLTYW